VGGAAQRPLSWEERLNPPSSEQPASPAAPSHFIRDIVLQDLKSNKYGGRVHTRFPPEPNGYLHIGHAKSICLNFGLAAEFGGKCNLRFDDTNPSKEEVEYVDSIIQDVRWLGFDWEDRLFYASDYFDQLYAWAIQLIRSGKSLRLRPDRRSGSEHRGTLNEPGRNSPYRDRSVEENLDLFERMRAGEFPDGTRTLRAKVDMGSPNLNMRDPVMYRNPARQSSPHRDKWCIYPMYDYTHGESDSIEGITHSICTLEFEDHRPLRLVRRPVGHLSSAADRIRPAQPHLHRPQQAQAPHARPEGLRRRLDDPRMPTLSGIRRRGYTPEGIRAFCSRIGVSKTNGTIEFALLEHAVRRI